MTNGLAETFTPGQNQGVRAVRGYPQSVMLQQSVRPRCNIGPDDVAQRRRAAMPATVLTAIVAPVLLTTHAPAPIRFLLWPIVAGAAVGWLQVVHRFCVAFGALGLESFGRLGQESHVEAVQRAADRRRALQLILEGALIGLVVTLTVVAIPI